MGLENMFAGIKPVDLEPLLCIKRALESGSTCLANDFESVPKAVCHLEYEQGLFKIVPAAKVWSGLWQVKISDIKNRCYLMDGNTSLSFDLGGVSFEFIRFVNFRNSKVTINIFHRVAKPDVFEVCVTYERFGSVDPEQLVERFLVGVVLINARETGAKTHLGTTKLKVYVPANDVVLDRDTNIFTNQLFGEWVDSNLLKTSSDGPPLRIDGREAAAAKLWVIAYDNMLFINKNRVFIIELMEKLRSMLAASELGERASLINNAQR